WRPRASTCCDSGTMTCCRRPIRCLRRSGTPCTRRTLTPTPLPAGEGLRGTAMNDSVNQRYMSGFGNEFATEAIAGTLPVGRNSPQKVAHGLYAEQLTGSAFTAPRGSNRRSWLYRIRPAAMHGRFEPFAQPRFHDRFGEAPVSPDQMRWNPLPMPEAPTDFIEGLYTVAGNGGSDAHAGVGIHL